MFLIFLIRMNPTICMKTCTNFSSSSYTSLNMEIIQVEPSHSQIRKTIQRSTSYRFPEVKAAREAFLAGKTMSVKFRRQQLLNLQRSLYDKGTCDKICNALYKDMHRSHAEAYAGDICFTRREVQQLLKNLKDLTSTKNLPRNLITITDTAQIRHEPHGVVLIIGPWNYPFYLTLVAFAGAIAAGNCVIIKPSELAPHSAQVLFQLLRDNLDTSCYHVFLGGIERTRALLTYKFDYIFFTGSVNVGRLIMQAAANHLTPVTLELGGKSPVFIHESACNKRSVKRIVWGKFFNLGQSCVAPDYILCSKDVERKFLGYLKEVFEDLYGCSEDLQKAPTLARIVNRNNFRRLNNLLILTKGRILFGGKTDEKDLWIEPTFVGDIQKDDSLMEEELFGPIMPIVSASTVDEAIHFIERPLALYIFSSNDKIVKKVVDFVPSGGVCVNDTLLHISDVRLPFGGTGNSGMGQYHGLHSFETFSHKRPIARRGLSYLGEKILETRYKPASRRTLKILDMFYKYVDSFELKNMGFIFNSLLAAGIGYALCYFTAKNYY